jgi:hypothetical protein
MEGLEGLILVGWEEAEKWLANSLSVHFGDEYKE